MLANLADRAGAKFLVMGCQARCTVAGRRNAEARSDRVMPLQVHLVSFQSQSIASAEGSGVPFEHCEGCRNGDEAGVERGRLVRWSFEGGEVGRSKVAISAELR